MVFDLDGTLADTLRDLAEAVNQALSVHGLKTYSVDAYRRMVGNGMRVLAQRAVGPDADVALIDSVQAEIVNIYDRDCLRYTAVYEGLPEVLAQLKEQGISLFVVTNKPDAQAQKIVRHLYAPDLFDGIYGNAPGRLTKPDPSLTQEILRSCHAQPSRSLFVGDSDVDIYTAANAGMPSAGVCWGFRGIEELQRAGAQYILHKPSEILNIY